MRAELDSLVHSKKSCDQESRKDDGNKPGQHQEEEKNIEIMRKAEKSKFSDHIDDIDIKGDEYYLKYYRSFHNHDLGTNLIENQSFIMEEDIHRKGAITWLPQGDLAVQYYTAERRREIVREEALNQFKFPFDHRSQFVTRFKPMDATAEPFMLEPQGHRPFLIFVDMTLEDDNNNSADLLVDQYGNQLKA